MVIGDVAWLELHHMIYMRLSENLNGDLFFLWLAVANDSLKWRQSNGGQKIGSGSTSATM